jgi:hypothetical protein
MANALRLDISNELKYDQYFKKWSEEDLKSRAKLGLQLINWVVNGSGNSSRVPPVLTGLLRGSGSAFVGSKYIGATPQFNGEGEPNKSLSEKEGIVTVGFNTPYAHRWHENEFNPGPFSQQSGDVGYKYLEDHLKADKDDLIAFYAKLQKKNVRN